MKRTALLQEVRKMRFEEAYGGWKRGKVTPPNLPLTQGEEKKIFRSKWGSLCLRLRPY
jgi:hypothetical protein